MHTQSFHLSAKKNDGSIFYSPAHASRRSDMHLCDGARTALMCILFQSALVELHSHDAVLKLKV